VNENTITALAIAVQANVPVILWGQPGTGKTATITALGRALNWPVTTIVAALYDPTDFSGLPIPDGNGHVYRAMPGWARQLAAGGPALLFFDELSTTPPAVQAALLRIVLERVVAEMPLAPAVRIVAAANPPEQAADGYELSLPLANRLLHLDWGVEINAALAGFRSGFREPAIPLLPDGWEEMIGEVRARFAAFLSARPHLLQAVPQDATLRGHAWPSMRSWHQQGAIALAAARAVNAHPQVGRLLLAGAIGHGAAEEYLAWERSLDLPDPERVLAAASTFPLPERSDVLYAVLSSVLSALKRQSTPQRYEAAWRILLRAAERKRDVALFIARDLARIGDEHDPPLLIPLEAVSLLPSLQKIRGV
jgi:hypothetical protein